MHTRHTVAANLAAAFLAGPWTVAAMVRRGAQACGGRERWLRALARRLVQRFATPPTHLGASALAALIGNDRGFERGWPGLGETPLRRLYWVKGVMAPAPGPPASWNVPALTSAGELAAWLGLESAQLDWLAGLQGRAFRTPPGPLCHYTYRWLTTRRGKARLLEIPRGRLRAVQRRLLRNLLDRVPPHEAAHGYRRGRSVRTYVAPHAGRRVVLHLDLRHFFAAVRASRVHALFRTAGYPRTVARLLTGLCTSVVPREVLDTRPTEQDEDRALLLHHLPQGAPTSPALANLCAYRLDCRLAGLSRAAGAAYTRYADDLVFSGDEDFEHGLRRFHVHVCRIALEEGFEVNTRKSHFMRQGVRKQVAGIVLNARPNLLRSDHDRLEAILTNCVRHGPGAQNRAGHADFRAHLAGRVAYAAMINPSRGQRLRDLFKRIRWEEPQELEHG
jgi:hypothetical protein